MISRVPPIASTITVIVLSQIHVGPALDSP